MINLLTNIPLWKSIYFLKLFILKQKRREEEKRRKKKRKEKNEEKKKKRKYFIYRPNEAIKSNYH